MNQIHRILFWTLALSVTSASWAADRWETLRAINMVENPTNQTGYGSRGELGPYQFRSTTWKSYTKRPFRMANDRLAADEIAVKHYEWLKKRLIDAGIDANSYNIAMAWNCGITAVVNGRIPVQSYHYAERVTNLAENYAMAKAAPQEEPAMVVVKTEAAKPPQDQLFAFSLGQKQPDFRIAADPIKFRVVGSSPQFILPPPAGRMFVFAAN